MFLDIGVGILLSIWTSWFFEVDLTFQLLFLAIIFSLLPDIDFFVEFFKHGSVGGRVIREHRELIHFPLLYIPVILIVFLFFGTMWASLLGLSLLAHFLHDSFGIGWGIKWLWPFSKRTYKFFSEKNGKLSSRVLMSWDQKELAETVSEHGDPNWIKNIYLRPSLINILECLSCIGALIVLYFYLNR